MGSSSSNTDPATWTNWVSAHPITLLQGNNDEFKADLGTMIPAAGTYYYATRFQLNADPYVYGGYNGGFWDGTTNASGTLTVTNPIPDPDFDWVNLQYPGNGTIEPSQEFIVFAQAYIQGITGGRTRHSGIQAWIGYSTSNTNPDTCGPTGFRLPTAGRLGITMNSALTLADSYPLPVYITMQVVFN